MKELSVREVLEIYETDLEELLKDSVFDRSIYFPTTCPHQCEVEADGDCEHGFPSVLKKEGLI